MIHIPDLIGESPLFLAEVQKLREYAASDFSVLITGETGTGKEVFAQAIHYESPRAGQRFVAINCGAIPEGIIENELFGHSPEAFTGAVSPTTGLLRTANGGTLFLDEVDALAHSSQGMLLRFLQEKEVRALGSGRNCAVDVRVLAASNVDFEEAVRSGKVREDLYYRLVVLRFNLPALRDRRGDIPLLAVHFLAKYTEKAGKPVKRLLPAAMNKLSAHYWPGNVRELENTIKRATISAKKGPIQAENITFQVPVAVPQMGTLSEEKAKFVTECLQKYLCDCNWNVTKAAQAAGIARPSFSRLMRKHDLGSDGQPPQA